MWCCSRCETNKITGFKVNGSESAQWLRLKNKKVLPPVKSLWMPCQDRLYGRERETARECRGGESAFGL